MVDVIDNIEQNTKDLPWGEIRDDSEAMIADELYKFFTDKETYDKYVTDPHGKLISDWKMQERHHPIAKIGEIATLFVIEPALMTAATGLDIVSHLVTGAVKGGWGGTKATFAALVGVPLGALMQAMSPVAMAAAGILSGNPYTQIISPALMDYADWAEEGSVRKWAEGVGRSGAEDFEEALSETWEATGGEREAMTDSWRVAAISAAMLGGGASLQEVKEWNNSEYERLGLYDEALPDPMVLLWGPKGAVVKGVWRVSQEYITDNNLTDAEVRAMELEANQMMVNFESDTMDIEQVEAIADFVAEDNSATYNVMVEANRQAMATGRDPEEFLPTWEKPEDWKEGDYIPEWIDADAYAAYEASLLGGQEERIENAKLQAERAAALQSDRESYELGDDSIFFWGDEEDRIQATGGTSEMETAPVESGVKAITDDEFYGAEYRTWDDVVDDTLDYLQEDPYQIQGLLQNRSRGSTRGAEYNEEGDVVYLDVNLDGDDAWYDNITRDKDGLVTGFRFSGGVDDDDIAEFIAERDENGRLTRWVRVNDEEV